MKPDLTLLRGRRVCVALSGGKDSAALFHYLCACAAAEGISLSAVHVEHGIRGKDSLADAAFVRDACASAGVPLYAFAADVPALAAARGRGVEEEARRVRYAAFARVLVGGGADVVATAHHAGDNAESVLFHLFRGASLTGAGGIRAFLPLSAFDRGEEVSLAALPWSAPLPAAGEGTVGEGAGTSKTKELAAEGDKAATEGDKAAAERASDAENAAERGVVRPLLCVPPRDIASYVQAHGIAHCEDATNADTAYTRNYLRARVLAPAREKFLAVDGALYAFSRRAREDDDFLYSLAKSLISVQGKSVAVRIGPRPLFLRACVCALRALGVEQNYTAADLEAVRAIAQGGGGRMADLPQGVVARREYGRILFSRPPAPAKKPAPAGPAPAYPFGEGEFVFVGFTLRVRFVPAGAPLPAAAFAAPAARSCGQAGEGAFIPRPLAVSAAAIPAGCALRTRRPGDTFRKFGGGTKKLKDYFIDRKLPRPLRGRLPLLACGGEVLAVCGVEIASRVRLPSPAAAGEGGAYVLELIPKGD